MDNLLACLSFIAMSVEDSITQAHPELKGQHLYDLIMRGLTSEESRSALDDIADNGTPDWGDEDSDDEDDFEAEDDNEDDGEDSSEAPR